MKLVDLKLPKRNTKKMEVPTREQERWPYGMQLRFESEQVDKLPLLSNMNVGDKVTIEGIGEVIEVRSHEEMINGKSEKKYTVEIQLKEVGCEKKGKMAHESMGEAMARFRKEYTA